MGRVVSILGPLLVVLALPACAHAASSSVTNDIDGGYRLNDDSNQPNDYAVAYDQPSAQWVIFDFNGTVSTTGTPCIGRDYYGYKAVYCSSIPRLVVKANDGTDRLRVRVQASDSGPAFSSPIYAYGGKGDDTLYGGIGDDQLYGEGDNDTLDGQAGADRMVGGDGTRDTCCYKGRAEGVTLKVNSQADDGSIALDRGQDFVDSSNEILETGGGDDLIDTSVAAIPAGTSCSGNPRYELHSGGGGDRLQGSFCYGDDFDGGDGTDSTGYQDRAVGVSVTQDGTANDGRPGEIDNVRASVERVVGSEHDDQITGADRNPDPNAGRAQLLGGGGSDVITPGLRSEDLWADGYTTHPGGGDLLSYEDRVVPVNVSMNKTADDGQSQPAGQEEHDDVMVETANGIDYGFDDFDLGHNDDTYWGAYADELPASALPVDPLSPRKRSRIYGNGGADKFYAGTVAEDFNGGDGKGTSWSNSDQDLVSYLFRRQENSLVHVSISLDGVANDGQSLDYPRLATTAIASLAVPLVARGIGEIRIFAGNTATQRVIELVDPDTEVAWAQVALDYEHKIVATWDKGMPGGTALTYTKDDGLAVLKDFREKIGLPQAHADPAKLNEIDALIAAYEKPPGTITHAILYGWPLLFASFRSESDNVKDDIEAVQGSSNTESSSIFDLIGVLGSPIDSITGNEKDNVVLGSPGPDYVDGKGGNDTLVGDLPSSASDDTLIGGPGRDTLVGGRGEDNVVGGTGKDTLVGGPLEALNDGSRDHFICGERTIATDSVFRLSLVDLGPLEGDDVIDSPTDRDEVSGVCRGTPETPSSVGREGTTLVVASSPGRKSKLRLSTSGSQIVITDSAGRFDVGNSSGCIVNGASPNQASCSSSGVTDIRIDTSNLKDTVDLSALSGAFTTHVTTGDGNDKITGSSGNDTIDAGPGKDRVKARGGDDVIDGGTGRDLMDGGEGSDTIDYSKRGAAVDVYLAQPSTKGNGETTQTLDNFDQNLRVQRSLENDTIKWAESVKGGTGNDILQGNQLNNTIDAGKGDDALSGGDGDDQLLPGIGSDNILAGNGNDYVPAKDSYIDRKIDCGGGTDTGSKDTGPAVFDPATIGCEF